MRPLAFTGEQLRAARAIARIEQAELARRSQVSLETIKRLERIRGPVEANSRTLAAIAEALEAMGVLFVESEDGGVGVRLVPAGVPARRSPRSFRWEGQGAEPPLQRLIYFSAATPAAAKQMRTLLNDIVAEAAEPNRALGVTGALFACDGRFLQVLEGPKGSVRHVYGAISSDPRHEGLSVIENRPVAARQFADWCICCGLFDSDDQALGHEPALAGGFHPEVLSPAGALGLLSVVRDLQAMPPRAARGAGGECPLADACLDRACAPNAREPHGNPVAAL